MAKGNYLDYRCPSGFGAGVGFGKFFADPQPVANTAVTAASSTILVNFFFIMVVYRLIEMPVYCFKVLVFSKIWSSK